jgi:hypothetical protein
MLSHGRVIFVLERTFDGDKLRGRDRIANANGKVPREALIAVGTRECQSTPEHNGRAEAVALQLLNHELT